MRTLRNAVSVAALIALLLSGAVADDWQLGVEQANARIANYEQARAGGNATAIREATMQLQRDPLAIRLVNRNQPEAFRTQLNEDIGVVRTRTIEIIRDRLGEIGVRTGVTTFEATNPPKPGDSVKVGQDWDLTLRIGGRDVPTRVSQPLANEALYEAATGNKPPPASDPVARAAFRRAANHFAEQQSLAVTDYQFREAYGGSQKEGELIISGPRDARLRDPGQLAKVIDFKSAEARNLAAQLRAEGKLGEAVGWDLEEMRQSAKQFTRQVEPRVREMVESTRQSATTSPRAAEGAARPKDPVPEFITRGQDILKDVEAGNITPDQAKARLAEMGETPASFIRKSAELVEAAQVLQPPGQRGEPAPDVFVENVRNRLQTRQLVKILERVDAGELTVAQAREQVANLREPDLSAIRKPRGNLTGQRPLTEGKSSFAPQEPGVARTTINNALGALWIASTAGSAAAEEGQRAMEAGEDPSALRAAGNAMLDATMLPHVYDSYQRGKKIGLEELEVAASRGESRAGAVFSGMGRVLGDVLLTGWSIGTPIAQEEIDAEIRRAEQEGREPSFLASSLNGLARGLGEVLMVNSIARAANSVTEEEVIFVGQQQFVRAWAQGKLNENQKVLTGIQTDLQEALARGGADDPTLAPQLDELFDRYQRARQAMSRLAGAMQRQFGEGDPLVAAITGKLSQLPEPPAIAGAGAKRPDIKELAEGLRDGVPVAATTAAERPALEQLAEGLRDAIARKPAKTMPGEEPKEEPKTRPAEETTRPTPAPATDDKPVYAVYGVHFYPAQPPQASEAELAAWKARVTSERTFAPERRPQGYLAFLVDGEALEQYRAHQRRQAEGATTEAFQLFRPGAYYSQLATLQAGEIRLDVPLFLTFFRLEQVEPAWVTRTPVGFAPGRNLGNQIQRMTAMNTAGSWTANFLGQQLSFGALNYEGEKGWGVDSRRQASGTMRFFIAIGEGVGEAIFK